MTPNKDVRQQFGFGQKYKILANAFPNVSCFQRFYKKSSARPFKVQMEPFLLGYRLSTVLLGSTLKFIRQCDANRI
jgi:hypothetical protein